MTDGYLAKRCFSYQNALAERVNAILKQEFLTTRCNTLQELDKLIAESIFIYNCFRSYLSLTCVAMLFITQIKCMQRKNRAN
ncbi:MULTISPECIES: integrase core domain-containing protein [Acinetobacter]|uniref:Transposase n=1 Tax=Acinetobacter ursingii TaxID=108980 RepID=A0A7T9UJZ6_9GAMM|nr:integrase core domain-containing protein [Acinetobacter ursingii]QQT87246.1 transposase [Acinetobacter ursingii]RSO85470.1 hypothetical protein EA748_01985 [Acinetobacter ursingii]